jgi:hypothetical protein
MAARAGDYTGLQIDQPLYSRAVAHFSATLIAFNNSCSPSSAVIPATIAVRRRCIAADVSPRKSSEDAMVSLLFDDASRVDASWAAFARLTSLSSGCAESSNSCTSHAVALSSVIAAPDSSHQERHIGISCRRGFAGVSSLTSERRHQRCVPLRGHVELILERAHDAPFRSGA